jgi:hypothetical protein
MDESVARHGDGYPGDRLQFVESSSGMAEAATAHFGDFDPACGHHRAEGEAGLVADAAG